MIKNEEPNCQANCPADNICNFAFQAAHICNFSSQADHIYKFASHWLAQISTDQSEALLVLYTVKPHCLGLASVIFAQILLRFAAKDLR